MSSTENTESKAPEAGSKPLASSSVFSMFGGGAKKEKKEEDEDRGDVSGSAKAQREAAAAAKGDDEVSSRPACFPDRGVMSLTWSLLGPSSRVRGYQLRARPQAHRESRDSYT